MNGAEVKAYSKAKDGYVQLSEHFKVREFACKDGSDPVFISYGLVQVLEQIRRHFGKAVNINSGFRTAAYNKKVGGAAYSQHQYGTAADISVKGVKPREVAAYAETLLGSRGGIGLYKDFAHVDVRAKRSRWDSTSGKEKSVAGF